MTEKQKTIRVLRINRLQSDGSPNTGTIELVVRDPATGQEMRNEDGSPAVVIRLRPIDRREHEDIIAAHTTHTKGLDGRLVEKIDHKAVEEEVLRRAIVSWEGIAGCDDKPLVCNAQTKVLLDAFLNLQIQRKLFGSEAAEVAAASFR